MPIQIVATKRLVALESAELEKPNRPTSLSALGSTRMMGRELP